MLRFKPYHKKLVFVYCCFQTFKDLFGVFCRPVFDWGCKGKRLFIFTKFIFDFIRKILREFDLIFSEELTAFLKRGAKISGGFFLPNFLSKISLLFTFLSEELIAIFSSGVQR